MVELFVNMNMFVMQLHLSMDLPGCALPPGDWGGMTTGGPPLPDPPHQGVCGPPASDPV